MEPQIQGTPSAPSSETNLDPSVVALTKAIGQAESGGNYTAPDKTSDGAGSFGAYQMTPAFVKQWAPKAGINYDPSQQLTPAQQDQIAYTAVKSMGQEGMTPAQVASAWNTGNPNAYKDPNYGKNNTYGSTSNYVNKIAEYYNKFMGTPTADAATSPSPQSTSGSQSSSGGVSPADIGLGIVGMAGSALPLLWKYAQKPIASAATDAAMGAVMGAPEGGIGAIPGAIAGAGAGIVQGIIGDITGGSSSPKSSDTQTSTDTAPTDTPTTNTTSTETQTTPAPTEAQTILNQGLTEELARKVKGRQANESPEGQLGKATIAESGTIPENVNGVADASKGLAYHQNAITKAANIEKQAAQGSTVPMAEVLATAQKNIESSNVAPDIKKKTLQKLQEIASPYGNDEISGDKAIEGRHQQYAQIKKDWRTMDTPEKEARKALGLSFRDVSLAHSLNPNLQRAALFEQQKHISATNVLKQFHNKPLSSSYSHPYRAGLYKIAAQIAEAYIGEKIGGPIGAIIGYTAGYHLNNVLLKKLKKTNFDTPEMKKALTILRDTKESAFDHLVSKLKENHIEVPDISKEPKGEKAKEEQVEKDLSSIKKNVKKGFVSPKSVTYPNKAMNRKR